MVTVHDVRKLALTLPRSSEHLVRDKVKFRVGAIVDCVDVALEHVGHAWRMLVPASFVRQRYGT